jgi:hypothetical protein
MRLEKNTEAANKAVYTVVVISLLGAAWKAFCSAKSSRETLSSNIVPLPSCRPPPKKVLVVSEGACEPNLK